MQKVIKEEDGSRWIADTKTDTCLYKAPRNPPNTGRSYLTGTDLFVHKTRSHGVKYYFLHWSMWQGSEPKIVPIPRCDAEEYLEGRVGDYFGFPDEEDLETLKEWGFDTILTETA